MIQIELPEDLRVELEQLSKASKLSASACVESALREKLQAWRDMQTLQLRAARGNRARYDAVLDKVPALPPAEGDELPL